MIPFSDWCEQAQLPADMRPALAPSCHNKIPLSVRQVCCNLLSPLDRNQAEYLSYYKLIIFLLGLLLKLPFFLWISNE